MKYFLLLFTLVFFLSGCSSIELEAVPSSEQETQKILALGLTHEENLVEASKLDSPHLVSVVTLQLKNAKEEKIQFENDMLISQDFADMVIISDNNTKFTGAEISESLKVGVLDTDIDLLKYNLEGVKDISNGGFNHKLSFSLKHNSNKRRDYRSVIFCDKWNKCENKGQVLSVISSTASDCKNDSCDFTEVMEVSLSDDFLNDTLSNGFTMRLISKKKVNKIIIPKPYLMGYLGVIQN